jgi:pimeloyl-ACP methyl ester carboxylesterase
MKRQLQDGSEIEFDRCGHGKTVVLLHAFPLSNAMWQAQKDALCDEFRVLMPNARGVGETAAFSGTPSVEQGAHDLSDLLEELQIADRLCSAVFRWAVMQRWRFARFIHRSLDGLVLCDTKAEADTAEARLKRDEMIEFASTHSRWKSPKRCFLICWARSTRATRPQVVETVRSIARDNNPAALAQLITALRDRPDATSSLSQNPRADFGAGWRRRHRDATLPLLRLWLRPFLMRNSKLSRRLVTYRTWNSHSNSTATCWPSCARCRRELLSTWNSNAVPCAGCCALENTELARALFNRNN